MSYHIVILGAGISGLATAWFLKQYFGSQIRLTIVEKNPRVGGWIQTIQEQNFLFEQGPKSCRTKGAGKETLALIEALGLQDQVIVPHIDARNRYLYNGQRLQRLPKQIWEIPLNSLTRGWWRALWSDLHMPKRKEEDESIQTFFSRRLGSSWTENLIDPFVSGIYAGNCHQLSLKSCFPLFDQWEQQQGSLLLGAWRHRSPSYTQSAFVQKICRSPLFSFQEGMESLPRALAHALKDCLYLGRGAHRLIFDEHKIEIQLAEGNSLFANHVISTLPTPVLGSLLTTSPLLAAKLKQLSYATVVVINMGFDRAVLPFKGFGYLVPSKFKLSILGCIWDSCLFPQQNRGNQTRLTFMMGGSHYPEVEQMTESELIEQALQILQEHLNIRLAPQMIQIKKARHAIPQFEVGYSLWKEDIQETVHRLFPHLTLSGSAWTGVSINDCIAQARRLVQKMHELF